jgi:hypothetical protein
MLAILAASLAANSLPVASASAESAPTGGAPIQAPTPLQRTERQLAHRIETGKPISFLPNAEGVHLGKTGIDETIYNPLVAKVQGHERLFEVVVSNRAIQLGNLAAGVTVNAIPHPFATLRYDKGVVPVQATLHEFDDGEAVAHVRAEGKVGNFPVGATAGVMMSGPPVPPQYQ